MAKFLWPVKWGPRVSRARGDNDGRLILLDDLQVANRDNGAAQR